MDVLTKNIKQKLNREILKRNRPSNKLQPSFAPLPVQTRYVKMPIVDCRKPANVFIKNNGIYSPYKTFYPGDAQAPWGGFATAIDQDSRLKNIFFPLQNCPQSYFVPNSDSDLYKYEIAVKSTEMKHDLLFKKENFEPFNPNKCDLGKKLFNNYTRHQVKSLTL